MFSPSDQRWLHSQGIALLDESAAQEAQDPQPMVSGAAWAAMRDSCDHATLRAIDAERTADKQASQLFFWRLAAAFVFGIAAGLGWVLIYKAVGL